MAGIGALTASLVAAGGARAQDEPYRSVAYDDPYFTQAPKTAPTPTFTRRDAALPAPAPAEIKLARAAPTMPSQTPRALPQPVPRQTGQPIAAAPAPHGTRLMRGRIEGIVGWDRLRGDAPTDGVTYGVLVGADRLVGHLGGGAVFVGPYGAARFSDAERTTGGTTTETSGMVTTIMQSDAVIAEEREIELGVRVGWATDRTALYASVGYVDARSGIAERVTVTQTDAPPTTRETTRRAARDGLRLGTGAEVTMLGDLYVKADYGYTLAEDDAPDRHQVTTGVGLRF